VATAYDCCSFHSHVMLNTSGDIHHTLYVFAFMLCKP